MRKILASVAAVLLASCGSSSSGGGTSGGGSPLAGHVGGSTFTPTQARAVVVGSGATGCLLNDLGITVGVKAIEIEAAAFDPASADTSACDDLSSAQCRYHARSQSVRILVAKVNLPSITTPVPPEPAIAANDPYPVSSTVAPPSVFTNGKVAYAQALAVGPDPGFAATSEKSLDNGTVTLTQVSDAGPIAGHVSITFEGGSSVSGDFSANACGGPTLDVCALANAIASAAAGLCTLPAANVP